MESMLETNYLYEIVCDPSRRSRNLQHVATRSTAYQPAPMPKEKVKMEPGEPANPIPLASEGEDSQPSWYNSDEELYSDSDSEIIGYDDDVTQAAAARASHSTPQHLTPAAKAAILRAEPGAPAKSQSSSAAGLAGHSRALGHDAARGVGGARRKTSRVATMNMDDEAFGGTDDEMFDTIGDLKSERLPASHAKKEYKGALVVTYSLGGVNLTL